MFNIGDLIIYSTHGICEIDDICEKTISGSTKTYYVLHPLENNHQLTISVPVNNENVNMHELMDEDEAKVILESFKGPGAEWDNKPNVRINFYTKIIKSGKRVEIAKVINTLLRKKIGAEYEDKKLGEFDRKILMSVQSILFKELAITLNTSVEEIHDMVIANIQEEYVNI